jgi:carbamate kinase
MRRVEAVVDGNLTAALLARRLDVDLFLVLGDDGSGSAAIGPRREAVRRFVEATERRAASVTLSDAAQIVRGEAVTLAAK